MNLYKELDTVIADYVGYSECGCDVDENTGQEFPYYDCADINLYNSIVDECSRHLKGLSLEKMSKDAQICIKNWEELIQNYSSYQSQLNIGG